MRIFNTKHIWTAEDLLAAGNLFYSDWIKTEYMWDGMFWRPSFIEAHFRAYELVDADGSATLFARLCYTYDPLNESVAAAFTATQLITPYAVGNVTALSQLPVAAIATAAESYAHGLFATDKQYFETRPIPKWVGFRINNGGHAWDAGKLDCQIHMMGT